MSTFAARPRILVIDLLKYLKAHAKVRHEVAALRAVRGIPGIVQLLGVYKTEDESEIVIMMAEVRAKSRHFAPATVFHLKRYMQQLLEALHRLHSLGIIHRDIKESNCLMASDTNRAVIIDLGLSQMSGTCSGAAGTKGYIAPELQQSGGVGRSNVDVFSAGVVFLQMMFCIHVKNLRDLEEVHARSGLDDMIVWIEGRWPTWHKHERVRMLYDALLFRLIKQMLNFDPGERPACWQCLQDEALRMEAALQLIMPGGKQPR